VLDLDLLFAGDRVIREPGLRVPHPGIAERAFVLGPLREVAPRWRHPETGATVTQMAARLAKRRPSP
jgi:2-amino-4-hydroxy-6-hydroxymethyldihydropteridine diphosphokinase